MSGKHLYEQMWINVPLFFKPVIKPELWPNRFHFALLRFGETELQTHRGNETKSETKKRKQISLSIAAPTYGRSCQKKKSQTVKWKEQIIIIKGKKKKKTHVDWMEGEAEGIVRCSSFLLWVDEIKEILSHGESEMSTD